jgi:DNA-directed RNA polymerase specialized sigma24 family protein
LDREPAELLAGPARPAEPSPTEDGKNRLPPELADFYRDFFLPLVRHVIRRFGLPREDAIDVVQDSFVIAIDKIDSSRNPRAWMYQVVDRVALNYRRKIQRRAQLLVQWQSITIGRRPARLRSKKTP